MPGFPSNDKIEVVGVFEIVDESGDASAAIP